MLAPFAEPIGYPVVVVILVVGYAFIRYPQAVFRVRNFPGLRPESGLTEVGEGVYRALGYLLLLLGGAVLIVTLLGGVPAS